MEEDTLELNLDDLMALCSGRDADNVYRAAGTLGIDSLSGDKPNTKGVAPVDCTFNTFMSGGSIVIQCDFDKEFFYEIRTVENLCYEYFEKLSENLSHKGSPEKESDDEILSLLLVPVALKGKVMVVLSGICYFSSYDIEDREGNKTKRIIFVFDNNQTTAIVDEEADYAEIVDEVNKELSRQEAEAQREFDALQEEIDALEKYNPFKEMIDDRYKNKIFTEKKDDKDGEETSEKDTEEKDDEEKDTVNSELEFRKKEKEKENNIWDD